MTSKTNKWFKVGVFGLGVLILLAFFFLPLPTLFLSLQQGKPVIIIPMIFEKSFTYEYVHSVQKTPVQEHFVLAPENILLLTSTHYQSLGVGLPFLAEEGDLVNDNGVFFLSGLNRPFSRLNMGFMPLARQALLYHGKRYYFEDYFLSGAMIEIEARQYSPAKILWQLARGR